MLLKFTAFFLVLFLGVGMMLTVASTETEAGAKKSRKLKKKAKRYKKFSKRWWRAYHNRNRQRKAALARKRALRLRSLRLKSPSTPVLKKMVETVSKQAALLYNDSFLLIEGTIVKVFDGDTVSLRDTDGKVYAIRMLGIDAPALNLEFGAKSKKNLADLVLGKQLTAIIRRRDSKNRRLGTIYCDGRDINLAQIESGFAQYLGKDGLEPTVSDRAIYQQAAQKAQNNYIGLWRNQKVFRTLAIGK